MTAPDERPQGEHVDPTPDGEQPAPRPGAGEQPDYHPADLTADQVSAVRREAEARAAAADQPPSEPGDPGAPAGQAAPADQAAADELTLAQTALAERTLDLQRLQAEYLNYKRRVDRDRELVKQNATFGVLSDLLPVLDDIDRAREHGELEGGFKAVAESLERTVAGLGLTKYGAKGDEFDPNVHEALMHGHSPEVTTTTVDVVAQAGYRIGERVVRAAKVTVLDPEQ